MKNNILIPLGKSGCIPSKLYYNFSLEDINKDYYYNLKTKEVIKLTNWEKYIIKLKNFLKVHII